MSIMLGAYGFFYGLYRDRLEEGIEVGEESEGEQVLEEGLETVKKARTAARWLAAIPLVVWLIFLGPVIEEVEAACRVDFSFDHYSAIDVAFFAAANAWLGIALILFFQLLKLGGKRKRIEAALKEVQTRSQ